MFLSFSKHQTRLQIENMEEEEAVGLKASLGLIQGCTIIVGSIIGSGIFIAPGGVLKQTGSVNMSLTIWILSGKMRGLKLEKMTIFYTRVVFYDRSLLLR